MGWLGRREAVVLVGTLGLLGGLGFVQSRGGWAEMMKMAPKRDGSTPAMQNGMEMLGAARITEGERMPRFVVDDLSLGGAAGPIGSTRLWFRLPRSKGRLKPPKEETFKTFVAFSNGEEYPINWEMADLSQGIVSILVPGGYAPAEWFDIRVESEYGRAKWRFTGIPKTPRALPEAENTKFEAEGAKVTAEARRLSRKMLNLDPASQEKRATAVVDVALEGTLPVEGRGVRLLVDRLTPEYQDPGDEWDSRQPRYLSPTQFPKSSFGVAHPYGDVMRRVGVKGQLEVMESSQTPISFPNARWEWMEWTTSGRTQRRLTLTAPPLKMPDGATVYLNGSYGNGEPLRMGGQYIPGTGATNADVQDWSKEVIDLKSAAPDFEAKVKAFYAGKPSAKSIPVGTITASLVSRKVVKTVPFSLVVPVGPPDPKDIPMYDSPATQLPAGRVSQPAFGAGGAKAK